jgi:hypothetical protein
MQLYVLQQVETLVVKLSRKREHVQEERKGNNK